ncbi:antigen-presenting glycoprotein CD1d-like isoform 4-T4 [Theristicus caerulescens]
MQPPHLFLFLFLPVLLPGMWADPEEPQVFQLLQTSLFASISSAEVSGMALLGDMPIFVLDPANWSIHFHWPWVHQATAEGDAENIKSHYTIFLRNMVRYVHEVAQQAQQDYPFVIQIRAGCVLHPNRTSWGFMDVGADGRDLTAFEVERQHWEPRQPSRLAELVSKSLNSQKAITGLLEHLLSISCQSYILTLCRYGKKALERQGSCKLHIFQTFVFHNTSFVDISSWATLEDIIFATLQKYTWNFNILYPWVYQALPAAEWENLQNLFRVYMHNFILSMSSDARLYQIPYPFVFQCTTGCDLYPNGSYTKFYHLACNTHDFLSFDVDNSCWERRQESELVAQVERQRNTFTGFSATLQHLLNVTCVEHMKKFIKYGRAALERQEPPVATVFARTPRPDQLLLVCRVTGFYPRPISVAWLRDGQEVLMGPALNTSTVLPNADLTYQLRSILAVAPHDGHSYACRVRHSSLGTRSLLIPWGSSKVALSVGITIAVLLTVAATLAGAMWHYRHRS